MSKKITNLKKGRVVLIIGKDEKDIIVGDCRYIAKKFPDGEIVFDITMVKQLPHKTTT